jgi:amphi-Trp domain-containing protein
MPYGTLTKVEDDRSPEEIASYLRGLAADLEEDEQLTATADEESVTVDLPPEALEFTVELERQPTDGGDDVRFALALEWEEDAEMEFGLE